MGRKKDQVWAHVMNLDNGRWLCQFCNKEFSGGATRIKAHLFGYKRRGIGICPNASRLRAHKGTHTRSATIVTRSNSSLNGESSSGSSSNQMLNCEINDETEVNMPSIIDKGYPDATESTDLLDLQDSNHELADSFTNIKEAAEYYENAILSSDGIGCTLIYSRYRSKNDIFAWTPNGMVHLTSCSSFRDDKVNTVSSVIEMIGATRVVQFVFWTKEIEIRAMLCRKYPHICHTPCAATAIRNLLEKACEVPVVYDVVRIANFIDHFICEQKINVGGREMQYKRRKSTICRIYKLISLLEIENELQDLPVEKRKLSSIEEIENFGGADFFHFIIHHREFWSQVKMVASIIQPLFKALFIAYGDGSSSRHLYEAIEKIEDAVTECCEKDHILDEVQQILDKYRDYIIHPIHAAAALLNPVYMFKNKLEKSAEMMNGIKFVLENLVKVDEKEAFIEQAAQYSLILSSMLQDEGMTTSEEVSNPRTWWEHYGSDLYVLKKYAVWILSQSCGSLLCQRYQLCEEDYEGGINMMLMERFKAPHTHMPKSIILEDLELIHDGIRPEYFNDEEEEEDYVCNIDWIEKK